MEDFRTELSDRLLDFAVGCVKLSFKLNQVAMGKALANQLLRSATSAGANYQEGCGAESLADFVHKLQITLKELLESFWWLKVVARAEMIPSDQVRPLLNESDELRRIIAKSVLTAKTRLATSRK